MLTRQEIQAIIESQGMRASFRSPPMRGDGTSITYVRAKNTSVFLSLGRIEQVTTMSQDELVETIQQKFAEKLEQKLQTTDKE